MSARRLFLRLIFIEDSGGLCFEGIPIFQDLFFYASHSGPKGRH